MTYRQAREQAAGVLAAAGIPEAKTDAALLQRHAAGFDMTAALLHDQEEMPEELLTRYREMTGRRAAREPLQHITGVQSFMGYDFQAGPQALVPRQDTELLVYEALQVLRRRGDSRQQLRVLDICTGTGCIILSLAKEFPGPAYYGSDISPEALELAERNAAALQAEVTLLQSDLLENIAGSFDLIVSNPPYIAEAEILTLEPEVRDHDPHLALSGGEDGLVIYRRLIPAACGQLKTGGSLMLEIGADQGETVPALMKAAGFAEIRLLQDLTGRDRVVTAVKA